MNADVGSPPQPASGHARPRVWWCPVGPFTVIPLHAAGQYSYDSSTMGTSDYMVSSYIPTISSLNSAPWAVGASSNGGKVLQVVQLSLPETARLPGTVDVQLEHLQKHVPPGALLYSGSLHFVEALARDSNALPILEETARHWLRLHIPPRTAQPERRRGSDIQSEWTELSRCTAFYTPYDSFTNRQLYPDFTSLAAVIFAAGYRSNISTMW